MYIKFYNRDRKFENIFLNQHQQNQYIMLSFQQVYSNTTDQITYYNSRISYTYIILYLYLALYVRNVKKNIYNRLKQKLLIKKKNTYMYINLQENNLILVIQIPKKKQTQLYYY